MPVLRQDGVLTHPYRTLTAAFAAWKLFLLAIAVGSCVGDAYDTSASLAVLGTSSLSPSLPAKLMTRFASWDAIYFVSAARRGYLFEQEWAFGTGFPIAIRSVIKALAQLGLVPKTAYPSLSAGQGIEGSALLETLVGILVANTSHLLSAIVLYRLGLLVWRSHSNGPLLALFAALLHVISPAGLFLSAPNAESSFSLLSFLGYLLYARSCLATSSIVGDVYLILAGLSFGVATAFRSNGILNGVPFAWEVVKLLPRLTQFGRERKRGEPSTAGAVRRLLALGIGGVAVAAGSLVPQAVAYARFCRDPLASAEPLRPWCDGYMPSIYTFVQAHYWNNGFLRYWTLSNLPLFVLATPVLVILAKSGVDTLLVSGTAVTTEKAASPRRQPGKEEAPAVETQPARLDDLLRSAAAAQLLLAGLVLVNSHVQIITRISSGYPLWYWWLAGKIVHGDAWGGRIVVFMVMYAAIQGALFASFLPPA